MFTINFNRDEAFGDGHNLFRSKRSTLAAWHLLCSICEKIVGETVAQIQASAGPSSPLALPFCSDDVDALGQACKLTVAPEAASSLMIIQTLNSPLSNRDNRYEGASTEVGASDDDPDGRRSFSPSRPTQARRPSYGWIMKNEDREAEPKLLHLPKMSIEEFKKLYYFRKGLLHPQKKHKSRWDEGPTV